MVGPGALISIMLCLSLRGNLKGHQAIIEAFWEFVGDMVF